VIFHSCLALREFAQDIPSRSASQSTANSLNNAEQSSLCQ